MASTAALLSCGALPRAGAGEAAAKRGALLRLLAPLVAFTCGACLGAAMQFWIHFHSLCVPVAIVILFLGELAWPLRPLAAEGGAAEP